MEKARRDRRWIAVHAGNEVVEFLKMKTGESISCDVRATGGVAGRKGEIMKASHVSEAAKQVHA